MRCWRLLPLPSVLQPRIVTGLGEVMSMMNRAFEMLSTMMMGGAFEMLSIVAGRGEVMSMMNGAFEMLSTMKMGRAY